jgi:hypothetical protein
MPPPAPYSEPEEEGFCVCIGWFSAAHREVASKSDIARQLKIVFLMVKLLFLKNIITNFLPFPKLLNWSFCCNNQVIASSFHFGWPCPPMD